MFYEHRIDNGFNNWFKNQCLLNTDDILEIRLHHTIIDSLTLDKIYVSSTLSYDFNESPIDTITLIKHSHNRIMWQEYFLEMEIGFRKAIEFITSFGLI